MRGTKPKGQNGTLVWCLSGYVQSISVRAQCQRDRVATEWRPTTWPNDQQLLVQVQQPPGAVSIGPSGVAQHRADTQEKQHEGCTIETFKPERKG